MTTGIRSHAGRGRSLYPRILGYVRPYVPLALVAIGFMILAAGTKVSFAWIVQPLVDGTFIERDPETRRWVPLAIVLLFFVHGSMLFASTYSVATVGKRVVRDLRQDLFQHYLKLPAAYFDRAAPGALLAKITYNVNEVANAAAQAVLVIVRDTFTILFLFGYMVYLSPWLTLITVAIGPPIMIVINQANRRFRKTARRVQESVGQFAQVAEDAIRGQNEIKLFGTAGREAERFARINERNRHQEMKYVGIQAIAGPVTQFVAINGLALVLFLATSESVMRHLTTGALVSFVASMLLLLPSLKRIVTFNSQIQKALAAAESAFDVLDTAAEPDNGQRALTRASGHLELRGVGFSYLPGQPVLRDINLDVKPGQTVALVGRSGSGKSTLAGLLPRLHDPDAGSILLDGIPLTDYRLEDLRRQIAMVSQNVVLFNDTVANNLAYGATTAVDGERLRQAAADANALQFIEALPDGFDTLVGENGLTLSGGQRQRLAIARALLKDAPILILDEATSALDTESERLIQDALQRLMTGRTTLVIAHRLSTIEHADRIAVLDNGRMIECGRHEELLQQRGVYAGLYQTLTPQEGGSEGRNHDRAPRL